MITNRANEMKNEIKSAVSEAQDYPEVNDLQQDVRTMKRDAANNYNAIKSDVANLASRAKEDASVLASKVGREIEHQASEKYAYLKDETQRQLDRIEAKVHAKPMQSVGIAFAAGFVLALLAGRSGR